MGFKNFRFQLALRMLCTMFFLSAFILTVFNGHYIFISIFFLLAFIYMMFNLYSYIDRINNHYISFLESIINSDFNRIFHFQSLGGSFFRLHQLFDRVRIEVQQIKSQRDEQIYYLNMVIDQLGIGILTYDQAGKIDRINQAGKTIFMNNNPYYVRDLYETHHDLIEIIQSLKDDEKITYKSELNHESKTYMVQCTRLQFKDKWLKLITIQDIRSEMEENEIEAWQKLIRVLTHEIMNSITPITSLASTISVMIDEHTPQNYSDIKNAVDTIHKRSVGLLSFVESFRNLVKIPKPVYKSISTSDFLNRLNQLTAHSLKNSSIKVMYHLPINNFNFTSDERLLEQAMINLINNALEVLDNSTQGTVEIFLEKNDLNQIKIRVIDNGPGIPKNNLDKIFIPFYTTKKNGSGIGLSIVKQVINRLKGRISVQSETNISTCFEIILPQ